MRLTLPLLSLAACYGSAGPLPGDNNRTQTEVIDSAAPADETVVDSPAADTDIIPLPGCPEVDGARWRSERRVDGEIVPFGPGEVLYFGIDGIMTSVITAFDLPSPPDPRTRLGIGRIDLLRDDGRVFATSVQISDPRYQVFAVHQADGRGVPISVRANELVGVTSPGLDLNLDRAWVDGTPAVFHVEMEVATVCRSVQDIPVIVRVNEFRDGEPYPFVWLDREAPPGTRPPPETPETPVEIGGGDSGLP